MTKEQIAKKLYAEALLKNPNDVYKAALSCTRNDYPAALKIVEQWTYDDEVLDFKDQLLAERGHESFLPSKEQMLEDILLRAKTCIDNDQYVKLMKLAADMRGMIEKPGLTINNTVTTNKVMNIPIYLNQQGSPIIDAEWEKKAIAQQESLTSR